MQTINKLSSKNFLKIFSQHPLGEDLYGNFLESHFTEEMVKYEAEKWYGDYDEAISQLIQLSISIATMLDFISNETGEILQSINLNTNEVPQLNEMVLNTNPKEIAITLW